MKLIGLLDEYSKTDRFSGLIAFVPTIYKNKILNDLSKTPYNILFYNIGFEEGEKCLGNVIFISFLFYILLS